MTQLTPSRLHDLAAAASVALGADRDNAPNVSLSAGRVSTYGSCRHCWAQNVRIVARGLCDFCWQQPTIRYSYPKDRRSSHGQRKASVVIECRH